MISGQKTRSFGVRSRFLPGVPSSLLQREKGGREQGHKIGKGFPRSKWNKVVWAHKEEPRSYSLYTQSSSPFAFHFLKWCLNGKLHRETPVGKINDRRAWRWSREKGAMRLHLKANDTKRLMTLWHSFCTICSLINWFVSKKFQSFYPAFHNKQFLYTAEEGGGTENEKLNSLKVSETLGIFLPRSIQIGAIRAR